MLKKLLIIFFFLIIVLIGVSVFEIWQGHCGVWPCKSGYQCVLNDGRRHCAMKNDLCSVCQSSNCLVFDQSQIPWVECFDLQ